MQPNIFKSAMFNGLIMGVLFSINFLLSISKITFFVLLSYLMIVLIIALMYRMSIHFREVDCAGTIKYGKAFSFVLLTFFYASLISAVVKYVYFQYINPGYLDLLLKESIKAAQMLKFNINNDDYDKMSSFLKPAGFAIQYIWVDVFVGSILGLLMAGFVKKDESIFEK